MNSTRSNASASRVRPNWWFGVLWVGAFVLPIAVQGALMSLWQGSGTAVAIGPRGVTGFVLVSATGAGLLVRPYVPRPAFWAIGPIIGWGVLHWLGVDLGWFALAWLTGPPGFLLLILVPACLAGAIQSFAFINAGEVWSRSRRARHWIKLSALTWLAMVLAPLLTQGFSNDLRRPFTMNLETWLVVALTGGAVSCAGILWILHKVPDDADDGAAQSPP